MKIIKVEKYSDIGEIAAEIICKQVLEKNNSVIGLATGATPISTYENIIKKYKSGDVSFKNTSAVNLDEYCGLKKSHNQSYAYFMHENLFSKIDIEKTYIPDGTNENYQEECKLYEETIEKLGGVDIQLLGLGHNGHIGFNEPNSFFDKTTHKVSLTEKTISANEKYFSNDEIMPKTAYTMGIGTIMKAKKILVIVSGKDKADILKQAFFGEVNPNVPASILQFHPDVTIIADIDAAEKI